mgnify:CR=1 FL=1
MSVEFNNKFIVSMLEGVEKEVIAELDKVAMRAHARLVTATPVDTGQARAGWNFTLNKVSKKIPPKVKSTGSVVYPAPNSKPDAKAKTFSDLSASIIASSSTTSPLAAFPITTLSGRNAIVSLLIILKISFQK